MTTATLRFASALALDLAISKTTKPHHKLIIQPGTERPRCSHVKVRDAEIPDPVFIEMWDEAEDFNPDLWPYEEFVTPKKRTQNTWLPVMTDFGRNYA